MKATQIIIFIKPTSEEFFSGYFIISEKRIDYELNLPISICEIDERWPSLSGEFFSKIVKIKFNETEERLKEDERIFFFSLLMHFFDKFREDYRIIMIDKNPWIIKKSSKELIEMKRLLSVEFLEKIKISEDAREMLASRFGCSFS